MEKRTVQLDGRWEFKEFPESARRMRDLEDDQWMATDTPASVYAGLIEAGCFSRFDLEANPEDFDWVSDRPWIYRKHFELDAAFCRADDVELVFDGLDTVTQIWLNEKLIGKTENMFIPHRFSVGDRVRVGSNTLMIKFLPAAAHAHRLMHRYGKMSDYHYGDPCRSYVRKAQYQFGSVLGPALPGCGIFRPVRLEAVGVARLENVHIRTIDCNEHYADVRVAVSIRRTVEHDARPLTAHLRIGGGGLAMEQTLRFGANETQNTTVIRIDRPIFWQPVGYGVPHLYHLAAELKCGDSDVLDKQESDFGVRSIRLNREGQAFGFEVNDVPVYIKGANWTPLSMLPGTQSDQDYHRLLTRLKDAHINMLRVWGRGLYEDDIFYRLCDKLGILVWQDFMFASAYYPDRQWFLDIVENEAKSVVRRLRNHPCLALWCGNSRIDHLHETGRLGGGRKFYGRGIYHELLPTLLGELDPDREYLATTPFSDAGGDLNTAAEGTSHYWEVWNNFAPTREYLFETPRIPRFLCEFGLQSLPGQACLERICPTHRLYCGSPAIEKHDYQIDGDGRMARYCAELFRPPRTPVEQIDQTQLAQARAVKLCAEHLRANNTVNSGLLLWTANDCAPTAGFSAIDFTGQPKAVYYYARRFFAPILITLEVDKSYWLRPHLKGGGIVVVNDRNSPLTAMVRCRCMDVYGQVFDEVEYPVAVGPFASSRPRVLPQSLACPQLPNRAALHLEVVSESNVLAENLFFYLPDKYIDWPAAAIDVEVSTPGPTGQTLTLTSPTLVRDVCITPPTEGTVEDNYFDLLPGQPRLLRIDYPRAAPSTRIPPAIRSVPCCFV